MFRKLFNCPAVGLPSACDITWPRPSADAGSRARPPAPGRARTCAARPGSNGTGAWSSTGTGSRSCSVETGSVATCSAVALMAGSSRVSDSSNRHDIRRHHHPSNGRPRRLGRHLHPRDHHEQRRPTDKRASQSSTRSPLRRSLNMDQFLKLIALIQSSRYVNSTSCRVKVLGDELLGHS